MDIGRGDYVECLVNGDGRRGGRIRKGSVYQVQAITRGISWPSPVELVEDGLVLTASETKSWSPKGHEDAWAFHLFRPIYRPKREFLDKLLETRFDETRVSVGGNIPVMDKFANSLANLGFVEYELGLFRLNFPGY